MFLLLMPPQESLYAVPPVFGQLSYVGKPRQRSWSASCRWKLRDGKIKGEFSESDKYLSVLLDNLVKIEQDLIRPRLPRAVRPALNYWTMVIRLPADLHISLRNTIPRYCKHGGAMYIGRNLDHLRH